MTYSFVAAQYPPSYGGVERYTQGLAQELCARGEKAVVVTGVYPGAPEHEFDEAGVEVYRLPAWRLMRGRLPVAKPTAAARRTLAEVFGRADRIVIQTRFYPLSLLAALAAARLKKSFVVVEHGAGHLHMGGAPVDACVALYEHAVTAILRRKAPAFYAVSRAGGEWLSHFGIRAQGVLYNYVDPDAIAVQLEGRTRADTRERYGIPQGRPVVLYTGRLVEEKGVLQLAQAVQSLQCLTPPPLAVFAGSGPLDAQLRAFGDAVQLLGTVDRSEVFALLEAAEVFCLPSKSEGMSTSVLEAAACGCYVITTDRGGSKELICSAEYGTILKTMEPAPVAEALRAALADPERRQRAALAAQQRVREHFTVKTTCDAVQQLPWAELQRRG